MKVEFVDYGSRAWQEARQLRYDLFFKTHALPFAVLDDAFEQTASHTVILDDSTVLAYGRLHTEDHVAYISQMVVNPDFQGKGLGSQILKVLLQKVRN